MPLLVMLVSAVADVLAGRLATGCAAWCGSRSNLGESLPRGASSAFEAGAGAAFVSWMGSGMCKDGAGIACVT